MEGDGVPVGSSWIPQAGEKDTLESTHAFAYILMELD
jgi:hypothetical protein